jgi:hypothetical protein
MLGLALLLALAAPYADLNVDAVLVWLPADTETIVVAQKSFPILHVDAEPTDALDMAHGYALGLLGASEDERLLKALQGQSIRFAVVAARKFGFRDDDALGLTSYEGCAVYAFAKQLDTALFDRTPEEKLLGHSLWLSKGSQNESKYVYTYRIAQLKPDLLLICNNQDFLKDILVNADAPIPSKTRLALPASLPEWKHVDRGSPFWGVRHFPKPLEMDYVHPEQGKGDPLASGSAMEVGGPGGGVTGSWITKSKGDPWRELSAAKEFKGRATSRQTPDGSWEMAVSSPDKEAMFFAILALMGSLGFTVNL